MYWAEAIANQTENEELRTIFAPIATELANNESQIIAELNGAQGHPVNIEGYYHPNTDLTSKAMRPSTTLNKVLDSVGMNV
jgi:isocitrate dehydrogenase